MAEPTSRLRHALADQRFPAARWELIAHAQYYGADVHTLRELHDLPETRFRSLGDVARAIEDGRPPIGLRRSARSEQAGPGGPPHHYRRPAQWPNPDDRPLIAPVAPLADPAAPR